MTRTTSVPSISKASDRKMFMMNGRSSSIVSMSEENLIKPTYAVNALRWLIYTAVL